MSALQHPRKTDVLRPGTFSFRVEASTKIYGGGLVALNASGNAVPASANVALNVIGFASDTADNSTGVAGAKSVTVNQGVVYLDNGTAGDAIATSNAGTPCYASDDHTANLTDAAGTRPKIGTIVGVRGDGQVGVEISGIGGAGPDASAGVLAALKANTSPVDFNGVEQQNVADITGPTGQTGAGFGTFLRTIRSYTPKGDATDAAGIQALIAAMSGGGSVAVGAGTATIAAEIEALTGVTIIGQRWLTVSSSVPSAAGIGAIVRASRTLGTATTLTSLAIAGTSQLAVTDITGFGIGGRLQLQDDQYSAYGIVGISGNTITVDRPFLRDWPTATTTVSPLQSIKDVTIDLGGALCIGTGDRAVELIAVDGARVERVRAKGTFSDVCIGIDLACYRVEVRDCVIDSQNSAGTSNYSIESSEDCIVRHVVGRNANVYGCAIPQGDHATVEHSSFSGAVYGIRVGTNSSAQVIGATGATLLNNYCLANSQHGVTVQDGSRDTHIIGGEYSYNTNDGISVDNDGATGRAATNTTIDGARCRRNGRRGLSISSASGSVDGNRASGLRLTDNSGNNLYVGGVQSTLECVASEISDSGFLTAGTASIYVLGSASVLRLATSRVLSTSGMFADGLQVDGAGTAFVAGTLFRGVSGDRAACRVINGTLDISHTKIDGSWGCGIYTDSGQTTTIGPGVDLSTCGRTFPFDLQNAGTASSAIGAGTTFGNVGTGGFTIECTCLVPNALTSNALAGIQDGSGTALLGMMQSNNDLLVFVRTGVGTSTNVTLTNFFVNRYDRYVMIHVVLSGAGHLLVYADGTLVQDFTQAYNLTTAGHLFFGVWTGLVANSIANARSQTFKAWTRALSAGDVLSRFAFDENTATMRSSLQAEHIPAEGSGSSAADLSGNARPLALTSMVWDSGTTWVRNPLQGPGTIVFTLNPGIAVVAMGNTSRALTYAQFSKQIITCTDALTADRAVYMPGVVGCIWTINNATSGAHNIVATGPTGATVNCAAGRTSVYWDGTSMVAA